MKVLVVGGAGYLGSHVARYLADKANVTVYDNLIYRDEFLEPVNFVKVDVCQDWVLYDDIDVIIWLAAIVGDSACNDNPAAAYATNVRAVERAANWFNGPFIFPSTASVYGYSDEIVTEESPFNPQSFYAETKVKAEEALVDRPDTLILRLATLHGPSPRMRFDLGVNVMTRDAVMRGVVTLYSGKQRRPWASVLDVANFICGQAIKKSMLKGVYNIVSENASASEVAERVCRTTGAQLETIPTSVEDKRDYYMDGSKVSKHYHPVITMEDSITEIARLLSGGRVKNPYADKYVNSKVIQSTILGRGT